MKFILDGLCDCGHDPQEDPNEDCERCWLITRIAELTNQTVEDADIKDMLRAELARVQEFWYQESLGRSGDIRLCCDRIDVLVKERDELEAELARAREERDSWKAAYESVVKEGEMVLRQAFLNETPGRAVDSIYRSSTAVIPPNPVDMSDIGRMIEEGGYGLGGS